MRLCLVEDNAVAGLEPLTLTRPVFDLMLGGSSLASKAARAFGRTELLQKIGRRNLTDPFLLCSTQQCQVYAGAGKEDARATRAIERTRGMVVLRDGGGLVDIRYSASCGGHTEDNETIWGGEADPSLRGRSDDPKAAATRITEGNLDAFLDGDAEAWCAKGKQAKKKFRWTERIAGDDLNARIAVEYPEIGRVRDLVAKQRGVSGRIQLLAIKGDKGSVDVTGDVHIRRLLGGLKSTLFEIKKEGGAFVFRGAGFGHGVGMCQMGAIGMADAGKSHIEILKHYYRGTHLHKLY